MTPMEAVQELGLSGNPNAQEAKRAYLRLLKTRKPEVDPEGFQKLRAAYELVSALIERGIPLDRVASFEETPDPVEAQESHDEFPDEESPAETVADGRAAPVAERRGRTPEEVELINLYQRAASIEGPADWHVMREAFERASTYVGVIWPPIVECIETQLALLAIGNWVQALELHETFRKWLKTMPSEAEVFEGPYIVRWTLLTELLAMVKQSPKVVWLAVTRAVLDNDPYGAWPALQEFEKGNRKRAKAFRTWAKENLATLGPPLNDMLERIEDDRTHPAARDGDPTDSRPSSSPGFRWLVMLFVFAAMGIIRSLGGSSTSHIPQNPRSPPVAVPKRSPATQPTDLTQRIRLDARPSPMPQPAVPPIGGAVPTQPNGLPQYGIPSRPDVPTPGRPYGVPTPGGLPNQAPIPGQPMRGPDPWAPGRTDAFGNPIR